MKVTITTIEGDPGEIANYELAKELNRPAPHATRTAPPRARPGEGQDVILRALDGKRLCLREVIAHVPQLKEGTTDWNLKNMVRQGILGKTPEPDGRYYRLDQQLPPERSNPLKGTTVPAKYRNPDTGEQWAGRGAEPRWMREKINQGATREDFRISLNDHDSGSRTNETTREKWRQQAQRRERGRDGRFL